MFLMATKFFKYDKSSAIRRTNAMELALDLPDVLQKIESRELCLESASSIQKFLKIERGAKRAYSPEAKRKLVDVCLGLSTRKVQLELAGLNPNIDFSESKKFISKDRLRISHTVSTKLEEKLERIKNLRSHVNPYMSREELLDYMAELTLDRIDPFRRAKRIEKRKAQVKSREPKFVATPEPVAPLAFHEEVINEFGEVQLVADFSKFSEPEREAAHELDLDSRAKQDSVPAQKPKGRYIKAEADRAVRLQNDDQGCDYVCNQGGKRCGSRHQVQRDHIIEYSNGGSNNAKNLRLYCAKHNSWRAQSIVRAHRMSYV
jgi:5-methylcytosine-specific restriction endonuclease McrA